MPSPRQFRWLRRSRRLVTSGALWRIRLVFWLGALAIGVISAGFAWLVDGAHLVFEYLHGLPGIGPWLPLVLTPAGFALCAWLAARHFPGSEGGGIPQAIAARHLRDDSERLRFLSLRIALGKVLLVVTGLACGASVGLWGPMVQIGASIMLQAARIGRVVHAPGLILAGSAAGIAAAFNAPLAGVVFAIEEMGRVYQTRTSGVVLAAVVIAGVTSLAMLGPYTYFGASRATAAFPADMPLVVACGVAGGVLGAAFSTLTLRIIRRIRRWRASRPPGALVVVAAAAGLVVALVGLQSGGLTFGSGYHEARSALEGEPLPAGFFAAKFVASLASTVSGIPGGLFAPTLSIGAGLGTTIGSFLGSDVGLAALLGMAAFFAGTVQAPMTSFVIILEMTGTHASIIPLMLSAMIGYGTARLLTPEPLYPTLARNFIADTIRRRRTEAQDTEADAARGVVHRTD